MNDFEKGTLHVNGVSIDVENLVWEQQHPMLDGVFLKHLIKGDSTDNCLSCHLVKGNTDCEISLHHHVGKTELHEILLGTGYCVVDESHYFYKKGDVAIIPAGKSHNVVAGDQGMVMLAKFIPELLWYYVMESELGKIIHFQLLDLPQVSVGVTPGRYVRDNSC